MKLIIKAFVILIVIFFIESNYANVTEYDLSIYGEETNMDGDGDLDGEEYSDTNFWNHRYYNIAAGRDECANRGCSFNTNTHPGIDYPVRDDFDKVKSYGFGKIIASEPNNYGLVTIQHLVNTGEYFKINLLHTTDIDTINIVADQYIVKKQFIGIKGGVGANGTTPFARHLHLEISDSSLNAVPLTANAHPGPGDLRPSVHSKAGLTAHYDSTVNVYYYNPNEFVAQKREAITFLSNVADSPSATSFSVYGYANSTINAHLNLTGNFPDDAAIIVRHFSDGNLLRSRIRERGTLNDEDRFMGGRLQNIPDTGIVASNKYRLGDYLFAAWINDEDDRYGYPVKFSFVNDTQLIVDNDQLPLAQQSAPASQKTDFDCAESCGEDSIPGYFLSASIFNSNSVQPQLAKWKPKRRGRFYINVHIPEQGEYDKIVYYICPTGQALDSCIKRELLDPQPGWKNHIRIHREVDGNINHEIEYFNFNKDGYIAVRSDTQGQPARIPVDAIKFSADTRTWLAIKNELGLSYDNAQKVYRHFMEYGINSDDIGVENISYETQSNEHGHKYSKYTLNNKSVYINWETGDIESLNCNSNSHLWSFFMEQLLNKQSASICRISGSN